MSLQVFHFKKNLSISIKSCSGKNIYNTNTGGNNNIYNAIIPACVKINKLQKKFKDKNNRQNIHSRRQFISMSTQQIDQYVTNHS